MQSFHTSCRIFSEIALINVICSSTFFNFIFYQKNLLQKVENVSAE